MATKKKKSGKIAIIIIAVILLLVFVVPRFFRKPEPEQTNAVTPSTGGSGTYSGTGSGSSSTTTPSITGATVFVAKKPYPKSDYVKWIQNLYNTYTDQRKAAGKTPHYPKISVDGVYGTETANAVYRYMGQYHTSWNAFKSRIDYYRTQL